MKVQKINPLLWVGVPLLWMVFQLAMEFTLSVEVRQVIQSEYGPHELLEFALIGCAALVAYRTLRTMDRRANPWLTVWIGLAFVCCLYVTVEEMSWGQTVFKWHTPEFWHDLNNQRETNLHNTSDWLNKKPRVLLEIGIVVGGLVIPLLLRFKPSWLPRRFAIIYPPGIVSVTALVYAAFKLSDHLARHVFHIDPYARPSEVEELYLYYFVLLYLVIMKARLAEKR